MLHNHKQIRFPFGIVLVRRGRDGERRRAPLTPREARAAAVVRFSLRRTRRRH